MHVHECFPTAAQPPPSRRTFFQVIFFGACVYLVLVGFVNSIIATMEALSSKYLAQHLHAMLPRLRWEGRSAR